MQARAIGEAGRRLVQQEFGVKRMVSETADLYRNVISKTAVEAPAGELA